MITCTLLSLDAQSIRAVIYDKETNEPLPFCTIGIAGKSAGTVANAEGRFILGSETFQASDTLVISHIGYEPYRKNVQTVPETIYLNPASITLNEVSILSRELSAKEIIAKIEENFKENHPSVNEKRRVFLHEFERAKFPQDREFTIRESDFEGLEPEVIQELIDKLPNEFVEYRDALVELYLHKPKPKLVPIDAISLEEQSMMDLADEMEDKFKDFGESIKESVKNEDEYFKFRTGILSFKADIDTTNEDSADSAVFQNDVDFWTHSILGYQQRYADINSENWEFITKPGKYRYEKGDVTIVNDELVYQVKFRPKMGGLFEGVIYCSTNTFGVLQVDYAYADGKSDENFHLFGIGHSMEGKQAQVIYEHTRDGYLLKYINASEKETASIERGFSFVKKEKRFLWDKTVNKLSMDLDLYFDIEDRVELLVMDREPLSQEVYDHITPPEKMNFRKEISNSPDIWNNQTILAPTSELAKYKRSEKN